MKISLCMIVKNEESNLNRCLKSIYNAVDEIIIVDTGSNDKTKEIAKLYTNKIYDFKWENDFAKARNYSLSKAKYDYILWLDADDYLTQNNNIKLIKLKENAKNDIDFYYFLYNFNENYAPFYRERLFKKNKKAKFKGKVHEAIIPYGKIKYCDIVITQNDNNKPLNKRNLLIYEGMNKKRFSTRDLYYYSRELFRHQKYDEAITYLNKFLKRNDSYIEDFIDGSIILSKALYIKNNYNKALMVLFNTFNYDIPRINVLNEIANIYYLNEDYIKAIYYYKLSYSSISMFKNNSFIAKDQLGYYQCISLCVCYFKINKYKKSLYYNELAYKYKKDDKLYLNNKKIIEGFLK